MNKSRSLLALVVLICLAAFGATACAWIPGTNDREVPSAIPTVTPHIPSIKYTNTKFRFNFTLPKSWEGYQVIASTWEGQTTTDQGDALFATGTLISLRHPKWTEENPRQDIPIMVFTLKQWNDLQADKFHIGAAPINPSELGRNENYVFALPARYNFAFPEGYEEVDQIIQTKSLSAF